MVRSVSDRNTPFVWSAGLAAGVLGGSLILSCLTPFAAIAVLAAGALPLRRALVLVAVVWIANQAIGFGVLHFPRDASTIVWGLALGVNALTVTVAASQVLARLAGRLLWLRAGAAFLAGFAVEQVAMLLATQLIEGKCVVDLKVISVVGLNNLAWFAGLLLIERVARPVLARPFGFAAGSAFAR